MIENIRTVGKGTDMLTIEIARERVAKGADWLDGRWPGWHKMIDLGTLTLDDCSLCVMGQIYTGCVPDAEKNQLVAQIIKSREAWGPIDDGVRENLFLGLLSGEGYRVFDQALTDWDPKELGFFSPSSECYRWDDDGDYVPTAAYEILTDAWTELIIQRRLDEHLDVVAEFSKICEVPRELVAA